MLITGLFGTGKSSVGAEIAYVLEHRGAPFALLDLDWFEWFDASRGPSAHEMMLRNLAPVLANYVEAGIRFFVLAHSLQDRAELEDLRAVLAMPLRVVRLEVPMEEIERRLSADVTSGRRDDLREAADWLATGRGAGFEDLTVENDGPVPVIAARILAWLGWDDRVTAG